MEREKFEDAWKQAFEKAEVSPSEEVWTNIELDLEKSEGHQMRRKIVFYKMVAAASVIFALAMGAAGIYVINRQTGNAQLALNQTKDSNNSTSDPSNNSLATAEQEPSGNNSSRNNEPSAQDQNIVKSSDKPASIAGSESKRSKQGIAKIDHFADPSVSKVNDRQVAGTEGYTASAPGKNNLDVKTGSAEDNGSQQQQNASDAGHNIVLTDKQSGEEIKNDRPVLDRVGEKRLPALAERKIIMLKFPAQPDPVALMIAKLDQREKEISAQTTSEANEKKSESRKEDLWTSVGFSAGGFNTLRSSVATTSSSVSPSLAMNMQMDANAVQGTTDASKQIAEKEVNASGVTYAVGVNMGTRVAKRWVLQGGVNYLTQSSQYTHQNAVSVSDGVSNQQSFRPASINEVRKINESDAQSQTKLVKTAPYNVNNNLRYVSVPIQAGFMVINKKFGLQLNAGISTDLFIENNKTTEGQNINSLNESTPYRPLNFSGLLGTEFTYRLGHRYRLGVNPGLRYPLNSIYKSDFAMSMPLTFDVGVRFRYIFH